MTVILALFLSGNAVAGITDLIDKIKDFSNKEDSTEKKLAEEKLAKEKKLAEEKLAKEKKLAETINLLCNLDSSNKEFVNFIINTKSKMIKFKGGFNSSFVDVKLSIPYYIQNSSFVFIIPADELVAIFNVDRLSGIITTKGYEIPIDQQNEYFNKILASLSKLELAADVKFLADQKKLDLDYDDAFAIDGDVKTKERYDEYMKKSDELDKVYYEYIDKINSDSYLTRLEVDAYKGLKPMDVFYGKCEKAKNKF